MKITDLNYLNIIEPKTTIVGGNHTSSYWPSWWKDFPVSSGNSASASFSAIAIGDNTYTHGEATLIVTENSSYSSSSSVAISSSS
ncbi:MAG: hypothetical protein WBA77_17610 [Microcoleaceae cyanobacterium]